MSVLLKTLFLRGGGWGGVVLVIVLAAHQVS